MVKKTVEDIIREASQLLQEDRANTISQLDIVNQLGWLFFLKHLEMKEVNKQCTERCYWNQWVSAVFNNKPKEETLRFLHDELHPHLERIFELKHEYMQINMNFDLFRRLLYLIYDAEIIAMEDEDRDSMLYNALLQLLTRENKAKGIFATPSPITKFMVEVLNPQARDIVYDPACGTGDFLAAAYAHMCNEGNLPETPDFYGRDSIGQIVQLARMNMILHGLTPTKIQQRDILDARDQGLQPLLYGEMAEASVILTHPPLGRFSFPATLPDYEQPLDCYEAWFLRHSLRKLAKTPYARCGMVISDTFFDKKLKGDRHTKEKNTIQFRKEFLQNWNVLMIVWLPANIFGHQSNKRTYLLFFDNRSPTGKVLHYNLASYRKHKPYTDDRPVRDEDFCEVLTTWRKWQAYLNDPRSSHEPIWTDHQWVTTYEPILLDHQSVSDLYSLLMPVFDQEAKQDMKDAKEIIAELQSSCLELQQSTQRLQELFSNHR